MTVAKTCVFESAGDPALWEARLAWLTTGGDLPCTGDLSCCSGSGLTLTGPGVRDCGFPRRVEAVQLLCRQLEGHCRQRGYNLASLPFDKPVLQQLQELLRRILIAPRQGETRSFAMEKPVRYRDATPPARPPVRPEHDLSREAPEARPEVVSASPAASDGWLIDAALYARWQLDIPVVYVDFGEAKTFEGLGLTLERERPGLLVIDHIDKLWLPANAFWFELFLSYAYNSMAPTLFGFAGIPAPVTVGPTSGRPRMSDLVHGLSRLPIDSQFNATMRSRLAALCGSGPEGNVKWLRLHGGKGG